MNFPRVTLLTEPWPNSEHFELWCLFGKFRFESGMLPCVFFVTMLLSERSGEMSKLKAWVEIFTIQGRAAVCQTFTAHYLP